MKKFFTLSLSAFIAFVFTAMSFGQAVIFEDNFDSYSAGGQLACQNPTDWTTWNLAPCDPNEDAYVSDLYALNGSNSVVIVQNNDLVKTFGDLTSGKYSIAFMVYIPTGKTGVFSTMSGFTGGAYEWAMSLEFNPGGSGELAAGGWNAATFTYAYDTWQSVEIIVDLDADEGQFWFESAMVYTWQWTLGALGGGSALQLAAINFWSLSANGEMYIDAFVFTDLLAPFVDDFESYTVGGQLACQNPTDWTTWSNAPCGSEDAFISDNYAYSGTNSFVVAPNNDVIKPLGTKTSGKWDIGFMVYIPAGKAGYFNCESEFATWWAMDAYFDVGGTGRLFAGSPTPIPFTWVEDTWQLSRVVVDLDLDLAEFWFDEVLIHSWQWTLGSVGQGGPLQLDVVDFWGATADNEMYVDDFMFGQYPTVPVELTSFTATSQTGKVYLNWATATELNNLGFEIERKILNNQNEGEWIRIGFVDGNGTTTETKEYFYIDDINTIQASSLSYRLKQIDFLGSYEYSDEVLVDNPAPSNYALQQNYPNPFNPVTTIKYSLPQKSQVEIVVYNTLGEKVKQLVNGENEAGSYSVELNATGFPSGIYFYRFQAGDPSTGSGQGFVETKKMILMK